MQFSLLTQFQIKIKLDFYEYIDTLKIYRIYDVHIDLATILTVV